MPSALMVLISANSSSTRSGGEAERRLVENEQPGFGHQAAADGEHLLFAAGEGSGALALPFGEPREDREHPAAVLFASRAARR